MLVGDMLNLGTPEVQRNLMAAAAGKGISFSGDLPNLIFTSDGGIVLIEPATAPQTKPVRNPQAALHCQVGEALPS